MRRERRGHGLGPLDLPSTGRRLQTVGASEQLRRVFAPSGRPTLGATVVAFPRVGYR